MNEENQDHALDAWLAEARARRPDTAKAEYGFETRLLARLREERAPSSIWAMVSWRLAPLFAAGVMALALWQAQVVDEVNDAISVASVQNPDAVDLWDGAN